MPRKPKPFPKLCDICRVTFETTHAGKKYCSAECVAEKVKRDRAVLFGVTARLALPPKRVRCLGPAKGEHTFESDGTSGHRMCENCRRLKDARSAAYSPMAFAPGADAAHES